MLFDRRKQGCTVVTLIDRIMILKNEIRSNVFMDTVRFRVYFEWTYNKGSNEFMSKLVYMFCGLGWVPILFCNHAQNTKNTTGRNISTRVCILCRFWSKKFFHNSKRTLPKAFVCFGSDAVGGVIGLLISITIYNRTALFCLYST